MLKKITISIFLLVFFCNQTTFTQEWTWIHHMRCNDIVRVTNRAKKTLFFEKSAVKHFTQLVFSWNALRPEQGYFSFYVQVRNAETQRWGVWHHMADWGADRQQSYLSKTDGFSSFIHVRLEIDEKRVADAFRIKIIPHNNASLSLIHNLSVNISDFTRFKMESVLDNESQSVYIENVPLIAQLTLEHEDNGKICSPVSCTMLVQYLLKEYKDPLLFAAKAFDPGLSAYGSWPYNMAHAFEECNGKFHFFMKRMNSFAELHKQLLKGIPVIISVRGNLPGALKPFPHGHLMVVVGWDNEKREVLCHDPAADSDERVFKRYPIADLLRAWECSHRLSYVAEQINHNILK
jgi:hypothetical protein